MASERQLMKRATSLLGDDPFCCEEAPFTFALRSGGEEIRRAPFVYVRDLVGAIIHKLEENET